MAKQVLRATVQGRYCLGRWRCFRGRCVRAQKCQPYKYNNVILEVLSGKYWGLNVVQNSNDQIKLNLGCGGNHKSGYVNVDKFGKADVLFNLEIFPWPWEDGSVHEVLFNHVLEHLGQTTEVYFGIIKEVYRICVNGAKVHINVPHPRHDSFINDSTHVRAITVESILMFSKKKNRQWLEDGFANSPLGLFIDVDFELVQARIVLDPVWQKKLSAKEISEVELKEAMSKYNNVVQEIQMDLQVIK